MAIGAAAFYMASRVLRTAGNFEIRHPVVSDALSALESYAGGFALSVGASQFIPQEYAPVLSGAGVSAIGGGIMNGVREARNTGNVNVGKLVLNLFGAGSSGFI